MESFQPLPPSTRPETGTHQQSKLMIHEDAEQLLVHLNNQHLGHLKHVKHVKDVASESQRVRKFKIP